MQLKKYRLGELMEVTRGTSLSGEYYSAKGNLIRLTLGNFDYKNNCFKNDKSKDNLFFTGAVKPEFILSKGDIITPLTEQAVGLLGSTAKIPCSETYIQSQDVALIKCNEKLNPQFAFYLIPSKTVRSQLSAAAQQTKIRHTSPDKIKNCTVWIPEYSVQEKIGNVLSALDEKIALNSRINAKLEAMAKRLYDYWFVQFEFPFDFAQGKPDADDTFGNIRPPISQAGHTSTPAGQSRTYKTGGGKMVWNEQLKREIPEGWEIVRFKDCIKHINTGLNPRDNFALGNGNIKYITVKNLTEEGIVDFSNCDFIDENAQLMIHNRSDIQIGDILFASICPLGRCYLINEAPKDWDINESVFAIRPNYENITSQFLYLILRDSYYVKKMNQKATGSIFKGIRVNDLEKIEILLPPKTIIDLFTEKISPILNQQSKLQQQSAKLTALRDRLLPLLMNGQVAVSDNSEQAKQNSGLDYEKKFNKWLQNQGLAARGHVDMKTLRAIFNAMDDDDK